MDTLYVLLTTLTIGSYGFTWAIYKMLNKKFDELLTNHLKHQREELEALEKKVETFRETHK